MAQNKPSLNQNIAYDVICTTNNPAPVVTLQGRKLVSHRLVGRLFSLDDDRLANLLVEYARQDGCKHEVYVGGRSDDDVYCSGAAVLELERVFPGDIDFDGIRYLSLMMDGDLALLGQLGESLDPADYEVDNGELVRKSCGVMS